MKKFLVITACYLILWAIISAILCFTGCVQHILEYDYYLKDPNSVHVETLRYKQNVFAMKTDKIMTEAAFADVIQLKMLRSTQVPDPNVVAAITEGAVEGAMILGGI